MNMRDFSVKLPIHWIMLKHRSEKKTRHRPKQDMGAVGFSPWAKPSSVGRRMGRPRRGALGLGAEEADPQLQPM